MSEDTPRSPKPDSASDAESAPESDVRHPAEAMVDSVAQAASSVRSAAQAAFDAHAASEEVPGQLRLLDDVALDVKIELGRSRMYLEDLLRLTPESVIELDKAAGDPVDIYVNDRHVARGEVLVVNENFCVRVSEIIRTAPEE